jgi:putative inorganic carbon (HCO3(-)) transporter
MLPEEKALKETKTPFVLFMCFMVSFFLHIPARLPILGLFRVDLLLVLFTFMLIMKVKSDEKSGTKVAYYLKILFIYVLVSLPFVTWPGTALGQGFPNLIKAAVFFFFTYRLVLNEERLKIMVYLFIIVNSLRVVEPLVLHLTTGYWGEQTTFGYDQTDRLAGAPSDVIGANGLAFVIATLLPFYHYLLGAGKFKAKLLYLLILPVFMFTMALTLSRTGILAVAIIYGVVFLKSNKKFLLVIVGTMGILGFFHSLNEVQQDRYLSIFSSDTKSSESAQGRTDGWVTYYDVAMVRPIFGHGLGASKEANWHYGGHAQLAHNLWLEVAQELGCIGLVIFILYAKEIYKGFTLTNKAIRDRPDASPFLKNCLPAMQAWLVMNFLFSFASYGLTSYEWYLFGGFSAALARIALDKNTFTISR